MAAAAMAGQVAVPTPPPYPPWPAGMRGGDHRGVVRVAPGYFPGLPVILPVPLQSGQALLSGILPLPWQRGQSGLAGAGGIGWSFPSFACHEHRYAYALCVCICLMRYEYALCICVFTIAVMCAMCVQRHASCCRVPRRRGGYAWHMRDQAGSRCGRRCGAGAGSGVPRTEATTTSARRRGHTCRLACSAAGGVPALTGGLVRIP
jgi:hypothetical protein